MVPRNWIKDRLTEQQVLELHRFFGDDEGWMEAETIEEIRKYARTVKAAYEEAVRLAEKDLDEFERRWNMAAGNATDENGKMHPDAFQALIYGAVQMAELNAPLRSISSDFERKPEIIRLAEGRGNDDWQLLDPTPAEAVETAERLLEEKGTAAYRSRKHARFPQALLDDIAKEWEVSARTIERRLKQTGWTAPRACRVWVQRN